MSILPSMDEDKKHNVLKNYKLTGYELLFSRIIKLTLPDKHLIRISMKP